LHERFHSGENALRFNRFFEGASEKLLSALSIATLLKHFLFTIVSAKTDQTLSPLVGVLGKTKRRAELDSVSQHRSSAL